MNGRRANRWVLAALVLAALAAALGVGVVIATEMRRTPCNELPAVTAIEEKAAEVAATRRAVEAVGTGGALYFDTERCPGRVEAVIYYGSEDDRRKLESLWANSALRELPVEWRNV
jgi:hypothetical protein